MSVVLVHGAWHGAWCWEQVVPKLDAAGLASVAVDLPSVSAGDAGLADDAACVRDALDAVGDNAVLVGHSYGGSVVTEAGLHPNVSHIVYISAFALEVGESPGANDLRGGEGGSALDAAIRVEGGLLTLDPELVIPALYNDCEPAVARRAVERLRPHSLTALRDAVTVAAWREKPSTYAVCTDDRGIAPALQRSNAARIGTSIDWPTGHSPFLNRPDLVADLLVEISSR